MYQPYPPSGQPAESERSAAPAPVRTAVELMYAGAAVSAMPLIIALPSIGDVNTDVARRAPGGLPDRAGTLLVTVVTPDPM